MGTAKTAPPQAPAPVWGCAGGHGAGPEGAKFCGACGRPLRFLTAAAGRPDGFLATLDSARKIREHRAPDVVADQPPAQVTKVISDWSRDPRHDSRMLSALGLQPCPDPDSCEMGDRPHTHQGLAASDEAVAKVGRQLNSEYLSAEKAHRGVGQHVTGPLPPAMVPTWLQEQQRQQQDLVDLGRSLMPSESGRPSGSAVTVVALAGESRCEQGHRMTDPEATACAVCRSARLDENPDSPVPAPLIPAAMDTVGRTRG